MTARPQQQQSTSKQRLHRREDSSCTGSQPSSPFVWGTPSSLLLLLPASASAMAATSSSAGSDNSARSSGRSDGAEMISASLGDVDDGAGCGNPDRTSAWLKSKRSGQNQRCCRRHLRASPRIASVRKAKIGNGMCPASSGSGLDRAVAVAIVTSSTSFASPLQAPGGHFAYCGPSSSCSRWNVNGSEADMPSRKSSSSSGGGGLATAQAAPESELSSPSVWVSDYSGGGSGSTFPFHNSSNDDVRRAPNECERETAADLSGESVSKERMSPLRGTVTETVNTTPLTYAAVASSSLHGKRLPQSRVGFSQWRKRVYNDSASVPSTIGGASATHATTESATTTTGAIAHASAAVSLNSPFLSTPRTLKIPPATTTANTSRATDETVPTSQSFVDNGGNVADDGGGRMSFPNSGEHEGVNGVPQHTLADVMMPPLPPSVHRHQPTHLILKLPNASQSQQSRNGLDTDDGMACYSSPRTTGSHGTTAPATASVARPSGLRIATVPFAHSPAPSLSLSASEVASVTSVRTLSSPAGAQQQHSSILRPFTTLSFTAFNPTTSVRGGATGGMHPKGLAAATATAGRAMHRMTSAASSFNAVEILPGLFLGSYANATDTEVLAAHGISLVINCTIECPVTSAMASNSHHVRYVQCPLRDHSDEAIAPFFTPVTRIIHDQLHRRQVSQLRMARRDAANAPGVEVSDIEERQVQERLLWAWTDEAENVWAVRPSPVSTPVSVGRKPSFKESKRDTPCIPSSALGLDTPLGEDARCSSTTTSCSPSPMPGRTATFPLIAVAPAATAAGSAAVSSATQSGNNVSANMSLITPPQSCGSTVLKATANLAVTTAPPPEASALTPLASAMTSLTTAALSPLTIVDPRDCGGVLVCCRMGVSRSASFIIAYLILYGCTLAPLDDTASLFVYFLERERRIIEEAGGVTSFTDDNHHHHSNGNVSTTKSPTMATVPANASLTSRGSVSASVGHPPSQQMLPANSPWHRKRSAAIPVASPLTFSGSSFGGGCATGSLATPLSMNASSSSQQQQRFRATSPPTPIEFASRVCQPCWLLRVRERRLQQQAMSMSTRRMSVREFGQGCGLSGCADAHSNVGGSSGTTTSGGDDIVRPEVQPHHYPCRVFSAFSSSAPVVSHRSGSCTMTLLEATYADERATGNTGVEEEAPQRDGAQMTDGQSLEGLDLVTASTPTVKNATKSLRNTVTAHKTCVAVAEAATTALAHSAVTDARRGHRKNEYGAYPSLREQQLTPLRSPYASLSLQPPVNGSAHGDVSTSLNALLGVSFASSGGSSTSAYGGAAPAMTYRDAFDAVKRQKADVNPNIGFVLALRELAGGGDFNLSVSL